MHIHTSIYTYICVLLAPCNDYNGSDILAIIIIMYHKENENIIGNLIEYHLLIK